MTVDPTLERPTPHAQNEPNLSPEDPSFVSYLAVRQAMNALRRLQERYVVNQPASEIQAYVCATIHRAGRPLKMGDIAKYLCLEPQTITGLISRMEAKGLVTRTKSTGDRRQVLVDVTDEGRALWEQAMKLAQTVRRDTFSQMSVDEHANLAAVMFGIRDTALSALGEDPTQANVLMHEIFPPETLAPFEKHLPLPRRKRSSAAKSRRVNGTTNGD